MPEYGYRQITPPPPPVEVFPQYRTPLPVPQMPPLVVPGAPPAAYGFPQAQSAPEYGSPTYPVYTFPPLRP